jgi:hypothetical protein
MWPLYLSQVVLQLRAFLLAALQHQVLLFLSVLHQSLLLPLVDGGQRHLLAKGKSAELWFYGLQIVYVYCSYRF